jgi:chromosome segregation ATPase
VSEKDLANQLLAEAAESRKQTLVENERAQAAVQQKVASAVERVRAEIQDELKRTRDLLGEAQAAYAEAALEIEDAERKRSELHEERDRLREEVEQLSDVAAQREVERNRLKEECEWANQMLAEANEARSDEPKNGARHSVSAEEARIEALMQQLSTLIDDPATELAIVIRKTVERAQLDFYLKGLRYAATGTSPSSN